MARMQKDSGAMGTAEVMALIRAKAERGFAAQNGAGSSVTDGFRARAMENMARAELPDPDAPPVPEDLPPPPPDIDALLAAARAEALAQGRAAGHAAGLAEGLAQGRKDMLAEVEATLIPAREAFLHVVARLNGAGLAGTDDLRAALEQAVMRLAGQRAGQAIDALPHPFVARIAGLVDRVAQGVRSVTLRLNPDDLAAIGPHLPGHDVLGDVSIQPDAALGRGDAEIRAEGISLRDVMGDL